MKKTHFSPAARIALVYLAISALWILFSDQILAALILDVTLLTRLQTVKGWGFVAGSALLIYDLMKREMQTIQRQNAELQEWSSKLEDRVAERTAELNTANTKLREIDQLKSRMISEISHELRTPITSINLKLDLLGRVDVQKRQAYIDALKKQAHALGDLIEDVMDISWLTEGDSRPPLVQVNLSHLASEVIELHRPMAEAAHLQLDFQDDPGLPPIWGRPQQLSRMLSNLVANGIKFTPSGSVQVRLSRAADQQAALIQVRDTGIGIVADEQDQIFGRFFRGGQARQLDIPGTGLGLSIVKGIVDAHSGTISVASQLNKGTTFSICLPLNSALSP